MPESYNKTVEGYLAEINKLRHINLFLFHALDEICEPGTRNPVDIALAAREKAQAMRYEVPKS